MNIYIYIYIRVTIMKYMFQIHKLHSDRKAIIDTFANAVSSL